MRFTERSFTDRSADTMLRDGVPKVCPVHRTVLE
jgi:hypothetical protein